MAGNGGVALNVEHYQQLLLGKLTQLSGGRATFPEHWPGGASSDDLDRAAATREQAVREKLKDNGHNQRQKIIDALQRIEDGTYGACERCSEPIGEKRLQAMPEARHCVSCQKLQETTSHASPSGNGLSARNEGGDKTIKVNPRRFPASVRAR